ncbi:hypothetical protein L227DRAFT_599522 [Lentinus tigrinus ALCF2SS1-6]|uniref:F-box domain-containing protein n=1 Tax=Lentinus tigrinus ALCF2SS1-6 TaxID=1328759 RepID=A0A5C2SG04_9APHY|nr:hypothetical protein L227DRAFT_599522 [Lentinus tigrinus ALCF2SS1-6]
MPCAVFDVNANSLHFPVLRDVLIATGFVDLCIALFDSIARSTCALTHVDIDIKRETCTLAAFERVAEVLGTLPSIKQLDVRVVFGDHLVQFVPPSAISPFFALHALEHFALDGLFQVLLDDTTVIDMACAWPRIQLLDVYPEYEHRLYDPDSTDWGQWCPPAVTVPGLLPFALRCPRLQHLRIALGDIIGDTLPYSGPNAPFTFADLVDRPAHGLAELTVGGNPRLGPAAALEVAVQLSAMFPHLVDIYVDDPESVVQNHHEEWSSVDELCEARWAGVLPLHRVLAQNCVYSY